jgi:hypothetical protein
VRPLLPLALLVPRIHLVAHLLTDFGYGSTPRWARVPSII